MDFASAHLGEGRSERDAKAIESWNDVYQALGTAWHYHGLQCRHADGFRKRLAGGKHACRLCGQVQGVKPTEYLLPANGPKRIGRRMETPRTDGAARLSQREATVLEDKIQFHGANISVHVHRPYQTRRLGGKINVAAERLVRLVENGVDVRVYGRMVVIRPDSRRARTRKRRPVYGGFLHELPRKLLAKFPVLVSYDSRGALDSIEIFR